MVVRMRHTSGHTGNRRSHHALKTARFETCKDCGTKHLMHRVCTKCGKYRGRVVVDVVKKAVKAAKKAGEAAPVEAKTKSAGAKKETKEAKAKK